MWLPEMALQIIHSPDGVVVTSQRRKSVLRAVSFCSIGLSSCIAHTAATSIIRTHDQNAVHSPKPIRGSLTRGRTRRVIHRPPSSPGICCGTAPDGAYRKPSAASSLRRQVPVAFCLQRFKWKVPHLHKHRQPVLSQYITHMFCFTRTTHRTRASPWGSHNSKPQQRRLCGVHKLLAA